MLNIGIIFIDEDDHVLLSFEYKRSSKHSTGIHVSEFDIINCKYDGCKPLNDVLSEFSFDKIFNSTYEHSDPKIKATFGSVKRFRPLRDTPPEHNMFIYARYRMMIENTKRKILRFNIGEEQYYITIIRTDDIDDKGIASRMNISMDERSIEYCSLNNTLWEHIDSNLSNTTLSFDIFKREFKRHRFIGKSDEYTLTCKKKRSQDRTSSHIADSDGFITV